LTISNLTALQFVTKENFKENLNTLIKYINTCEKNSLITAPELCLTGYSYDKLQEAYEASVAAIEVLKNLSIHKTIVLTMITLNKKYQKYQNTAFVFSQGDIIYKQSKAKLFNLNDESKYFLQADTKDIKLFNVNGFKVAILICFELRFIRLWIQLQTADIILIPSMWGVLRKQNLEQLSQALAVANQCYVIVSNSSNDNMAKSSAIISPFGKVVMYDEKEIIQTSFHPLDIKKMRRYLDVGIN